MATQPNTIPDYGPPAHALDGTEQVATWQDGEQVAPTVQEIADFANGDGINQAAAWAEGDEPVPGDPTHKSAKGWVDTLLEDEGFQQVSEDLALGDESLIGQTAGGLDEIAACAGALTAIGAAPAAASVATTAAAATAADRTFIENNVINQSPRQPAPLPMVRIGQVAADSTSTDSGKYVSLPAGATTTPADTSDWMIGIWHKTGQVGASTTSAEVLAASGGTFASGSGNNGVWGRNARASTQPEGVWRPKLAFNRGNKDLMAFATTIVASDSTAGPLAFGDWFEIIGCVGAVPYYAAFQIGPDGQIVRYRFPTATGINSYYYAAATYTDGTVTRTGNVLTYAHASLSTVTFPVGKRVMIASTDHPEINGELVVASSVLGSFTAVSNGANFSTSGANASVAVIRAATDVITTLGGFATPLGASRFSWGGSIQRIESRWGTLPITNGFIDLAWLGNYANRKIKDADLPGVKHFAASANGSGGMTTDSDGTITTAVTPHGTLETDPPAGVDWLVVDEWDNHSPFASDYSPATKNANTGTVRIGATALVAAGGLTASIDDGTQTIMPEQLVAASIDVLGRTMITYSGVPNGVGYFLNLKATAAGGGNYSLRWGPFTVGPVIPFVNQSTDNVLASPTNTGATLDPVAGTVGVGTVGDVAGYLTNGAPSPTDGPKFCRLARKRMSQKGQAGDGMMAFTNTLVSLLNVASGRPMAAAAYMLCRSGHPADAFWADRQWFMNAVGTATSNVALTGTWVPHPMWNATTINFTEAGTVTIWRGGTFGQKDQTDITSPYVLTDGVQVGTVQPDGTISGAVSGTFDINSGAYTIIDPVGGPIYIQGRMQFDTLAASSPTGGRQTVDGFTVWGEDDRDDSGQISNLLKSMNGATAFHYAWTNYMLTYGTTHTQAQLNAKVAFDIAMIRKRIDQNYPHLAGKLWIVGSDMRTSASQAQYSEHKIRLALRAYAKITPNTKYSIGALTCDMDQLGSPHPGVLPSSGQLAGTTYAHGVAKALGVTGAKAEEVFITKAVRSSDGTQMDLTFNVPAGANLAIGGIVNGAFVPGDPSKIEGLFYAASDDPAAMTLVDVNGGAYTTQLIAVTGFNVMVRVTKVSGVFPTVSYWNTNIGWVLTDTTLANETTRLARTLSLDTGGYDGIRPGQPITFNPVNVLAS